MQYTISFAETRLTKLIDAALSGEEVLIVRGQEQAVRLVPVPTTGFRLGLKAGQFGRPPVFVLADEDPDQW